MQPRRAQELGGYYTLYDEMMAHWRAGNMDMSTRLFNTWVAE